MLKWTDPPRIREPAVVPGEGRVTGVEPDPRRAGALRVYVDGKVRWTVGRTEGEADAEALRVGTILTDRQVAAFERAADVEAAYRTALRHLERRAFATRDLHRRLVRKGHPAEAVREALETLAAQRLLDDAGFARDYVETRAVRGRGPARVKRDLLAMGVEGNVIDRAIAEAWPASVPPEELAKALAAKRLKQLGALPRQALRRRLVQYLGRRGFGGSVAGKVVREVLG